VSHHTLARPYSCRVVLRECTGPPSIACGDHRSMHPLNSRPQLEHQEPHARSGGAAHPAMPSGAAAEASASLPRLAQHVGGHDLRCPCEFGVSSKCKAESQHAHPARLGCEDTTVCEHASEPVQESAVSANMIPGPPEHCTSPHPTSCVPSGGGGADSPQLPMPGMPHPLSGARLSRRTPWHSVGTAGAAWHSVGTAGAARRCHGRLSSASAACAGPCQPPALTPAGSAGRP